jgi:hypothetical protein
MTVSPSDHRRALLAAVRAHRSGVTIYALARRLGRPYRRVHDAVRRLAAEGAVRVEPAVRNNRRATLVSIRRASPAAPISLPAHLSDAERFALRSLAERVRRLDARVRALRLFGSRARGDARWDSDLDVAVMVRGARDAALERRIVAAFADVEWGPSLEGSLRISPLVLFSATRRTPVLNAIEAGGVTVWQARS